MAAESLVGYSELHTGIVLNLQESESVLFSPNPAYERYLQMHKVLLGKRGAEQLAGIHDELKSEFMPRYLAVAGWAAVESALIRTDQSAENRLELFDSGVDTWRKALTNQKVLNASGEEMVTEAALPHRLALDIAVTPLLKEVVQGEVTRLTCQEVFEDCLSIAQSNAVYIELCAKEDNREALASHIGLGYECNALLAFNLQLSETWFAIPAFARADSGYYHPEQTHDLLIIHQKWGKILSATPMEVKAAASVRDRKRFAALLVRGKMHLSEAGRFRPRETLQDITEAYEAAKDANKKGLQTAASRRLIQMTQDYHMGPRLEDIASRRTSTVFRDNRHVVANHPGLAFSQSS